VTTRLVHHAMKHVVTDCIFYFILKNKTKHFVAAAATHNPSSLPRSSSTRPGGATQEQASSPESSSGLLLSLVFVCWFLCFLSSWATAPACFQRFSTCRMNPFDAYAAGPFLPEAVVQKGLYSNAYARSFAPCSSFQPVPVFSLAYRRSRMLVIRGHVSHPASSPLLSTPIFCTDTDHSVFLGCYSTDAVRCSSMGRGRYFLKKYCSNGERLVPTVVAA
jgi:hypothetical protein